MKIKLVSVYVDNPAKALKFYTEVLGFVTKMWIAEMQLAIVASPEDPNGTALMLEPNNNPIASTYQKALRDVNLPPIVFGVENVQKEYERLKALGVNFIKPPTKNDFGAEADFEDTCGNVIKIHQK